MELDLNFFKSAFKNYDVQHVYIEKSQSMPGQGVVSIMTYGTGFGRILGWFDMLYLPYTLVSPRTWTKEMHAGCTGNDAKAKSLQAVRRLFPNENLVVDKCRTPHKGVIDALLIAEYGYRKFN